MKSYHNMTNYSYNCLSEIFRQVGGYLIRMKEIFRYKENNSESNDDTYISSNNYSCKMHENILTSMHLIVIHIITHSTRGHVYFQQELIMY